MSIEVPSDQESNLPESIGPLVRGILSGATLEEWAKLSYFQRLRVRLLVSQLSAAFRILDTEEDIKQEESWGFGEFGFVDNLKILESPALSQQQADFRVNPNTIDDDSPFLPIVVEQEKVCDLLTHVIDRIATSRERDPEGNVPR